jgi:hypothetical protein
MLLFYEMEPDAIELYPIVPKDHGCLKVQDGVTEQEMDALPQYGSYAYIPYRQATGGRVLANSSGLTPGPESPLTLKNTSSWTYCGPFLLPRASSIPPSFHRWTSVTMSDPSDFLNRLIPLLSSLQIFLLEAGVSDYWLTIRATTPTNDYDTRRWHVDDDFFAQDFGRLIRDKEVGEDHEKVKRGWKLATTLLGPPTLFLEDNEDALGILRETKALERSTHQHACTSIRCLGCSTYADSVRESLAESLQDHAITSPARGEMAFFRLGECEGAVHSEPKCDVDRIFVNVVPGTEKQLSDLMRRWGMEFPRSWCVGLPGNIVIGEELEAFVKVET